MMFPVKNIWFQVRNQVTLPEVVYGNIMYIHVYVCIYIYIHPLVIKHSHGSHGIFIDGLPFLKMVDLSSSLTVRHHQRVFSVIHAKSRNPDLLAFGNGGTEAKKTSLGG